MGIESLSQGPILLENLLDFPMERTVVRDYKSIVIINAFTLNM